MILRAKHEGYLYTYEENIWTGLKKLSINGVPATKISRNSFADPETHKTITIKGNMLTGIQLNIDGRIIVMTKNTAFEWIFIFLPFLIICYGIFCGAIGGGLSAMAAVLAAYFNASFLRSENSKGIKSLVCIGITLVAAICWWLAFALIVSIIL